MNFINHNSKNDPSSHYNYFEQIISVGESFLNYGILKKGQEINIYFVDTDTIDAIRKNIEDIERIEKRKIYSKYKEILNNKEDYQRDSKKSQYNMEALETAIFAPSIDLLGVYCPTGHFKSEPEILVSYDKIYDSYKDLYKAAAATVKTIIHELAHAIMDITNYKSDDFFFKAWVEEALANKISLEYLYSVKNIHFSLSGDVNKETEFDIAKDIILKQAENYKLGWTLFEKELNSGLTFDWKAWGKSKYIQILKKNFHVEWINAVLNPSLSRPLFDIFRDIVKNVCLFPYDNPFSPNFIFFREFRIAGISFCTNQIITILDELYIGAKVNLIREKYNQFDENAIAIVDKNSCKIGYIPQKENVEIARLLDRGDESDYFGIITEIRTKFQSDNNNFYLEPTYIRIAVFLNRNIL